MPTNAVSPVFEKSRSNINETWNLVSSQQGIVEVRALLKKRLEISSIWEGFGDIVSGYFDNVAAYEKAIVKLDQQTTVKGIYITLNPIMGALSARAHNRLVAAIKGATTADDDIVKRETILIDCDPYRPSEIGSTQQEMEAAIAKRNQVVAWLYSIGFPKFTLGNSGNGAHAVGKVSLPNDDESKQLINDFLEAINLRFGTVPSDRTEAKKLFQQGVISVGIDTTVFNAGRISKVYGTMVRKGDSTEERPHRRAELTSVPDSLEVIPAELLEIVAQEWRDHQAKQQATKPTTQPKPYSVNGSRPVNEWYKTVDGVERWMAEHGVILGNRDTHTKDGFQYMWVVDCITSSAHKDGAAVFWGANKGLGYKCQHDSCKGKTWSDVRDIIDPGHGMGRTSHSHSEPTTRDKPVIKDEPADDVASVTPETEHLTDLGNGIRVARLYGRNLRYTEAWGWTVWDGVRWKKDDTSEVMRLAKKTALSFYGEAARVLDEAKSAVKAAENAAKAGNAELADKNTERSKKLTKLADVVGDWAKKCQSRSRLEAMIALSQSEQPISAHSDEFDNHPWLLNVKNGTVDLRTGQLTAHDRLNMMTKCLPCDFDADAICPGWLAFLNKIMAGDRELIEFLRRAIGYSLTGATTDHALFFAYGVGQNGKSTFFETIGELLGDYWQKAPTEMLMSKEHSGGIPNDVARLKGLRMVVCAEVEEGQRMAEKQVKDLTGGDTLVARFLNKEFFDFKPTHKVWMYGNHRPMVRGTDTGIWRRVKLIPFMVTIPEAERDANLKEKLVLELPGILAWAIEGCIEWCKSGLNPPDAVKMATEEYRVDSDTLSTFLKESTVLIADARTQAGKLYSAYQTWCKGNGEDTVSGKRFGQQLVERGFKKYQSNGRYIYSGIGLVDHSADEE